MIFESKRHVTVGIPNYGLPRYTELAARCVRECTHHKRYTLVIVDDGSPDQEHRDHTKAIAQKYEAVFVGHSENKGVATAWNSIADVAKKQGSDDIAFLNSDILVVPRWLECALYAIEKNMDTGQVGSVYWEPITVPGHGDVWQLLHVMSTTLWSMVYAFGQQDVRNHNWPSLGQLFAGFDLWGIAAWGAAKLQAPNGSCFMTPRTVYDLVGGFDERFLSFHEESDYGITCSSHGLFAIGLPYPRTYHGSSRTFVENRETVDAQGRMAASRDAFIEKWGIPKTEEERNGEHYFMVTHHRYMDNVPKKEFQFLFPVVDRTEPQNAYENVKAPNTHTYAMPKLNPKRWEL